MTAKNKAALHSQSDTTFASGVPTTAIDHRTFNDDFVDSCINNQETATQAMNGDLDMQGHAILNTLTEQQTNFKAVLTSDKTINPLSAGGFSWHDVEFDKNNDFSGDGFRFTSKKDQIVEFNLTVDARSSVSTNDGYIRFDIMLDAANGDPLYSIGRIFWSTQRSGGSYKSHAMGVQVPKSLKMGDEVYIMFSTTSLAGSVNIESTNGAPGNSLTFFSGREI